MVCTLESDCSSRAPEIIPAAQFAATPQAAIVAPTEPWPSVNADQRKAIGAVYGIDACDNDCFVSGTHSFLPSGVGQAA